MTQSRWLRRVGLLVALAAVYVIAGKLGLKLAFENASATPVWPCTGIALAAFVLLGYDVWPAVLAGSFLVNITTAGSVATALGIAAGNTLEGLAGAYLVNRFARGRRAFDRPQDVFAFTVLAGIVSTTVGATVGVTTLAFTGFARWAEYGAIWWTWWLGEAVGDLVVAPALVLWAAAPRLRWNRAQWIEAAALLLWVVVVGFTVFGGLFPSRVKNYPLEFLCFPFLIWAAFRFAQREAASAVVVLSGIAIWGTLHGFGPFVRATRNESLLLLQAFMGVTSVMTLALAALVAERSQVEERLRQLAVSDPLTGLANYRQLTYAIDAEIKRYQRTERPFAVVLLDMDGLKKINDSHGHLVGSLALCRVAETLFGSCRAMDTAARFGGDEFAVVLPETDDAAAWHVARRLSERVARDGEKPPLSGRGGVARYPPRGRPRRWRGRAVCPRRGHGCEPGRPRPHRRPVPPHGRAAGGGAPGTRLSAHLAPGWPARVRLFRGRGDLPRVRRHAHAVPHPHRVGAALDRARPAAHLGMGAVPPARRAGCGDGVGDGAGGRPPERGRDRPAARAAPARRSRLARRPHDLPRGRAAVTRGRALESHLHVVDAVHVALRHARAGGARRGAQGRRDRLHGHLGVRPVGQRARGAEPGRPTGGAGPSGRAHDGGLLPARHDGHRGGVPHDPPGARGVVHPGSRRHHRRQSLSPRDRARAGRADV